MTDGRFCLRDEGDAVQEIGLSLLFELDDVPSLVLLINVVYREGLACGCFW